MGSLEKSGLTPEIMTTYLDERETHWEMLALAPATISFPIATILIGIGLIRTPALQLPTHIAPALIAAGVAFLIAQGTETEWGLTYFYPASAILMTIGYATLGQRQLADQRAVTPKPETSLVDQ